MRLGHVALAANDPKALAGFYARFLGLRTVAEVATEQTGSMVLMSSTPDGPPELQLMSNPQGRHVAFKVDTLAELRQLHAAAAERGTRVLFSFDHGTSLSFYFQDPEGNPCEVYWETGRPAGGFNRPIDLTRSEEELLELIGT
jgi:catechol-2,3-dioxygenase